MKFTEELARLSDAATQGEWNRTGHSRIDGVTLNGILRSEDADFICRLANRRREILALVEAAQHILEDDWRGIPRATSEARKVIADALAALDRSNGAKEGT